MKNSENNVFEDVRFWVIDVVIAAATASQKLGDQTFLNNKDVAGIFVSGETKDYKNNTLTNSGFYLFLEDEAEKVNKIPASFMAFNTENVIKYNFKGLDWNKAEIVFPTNVVAATYVQIVVLYKNPNKNEK